MIILIRTLIVIVIIIISAIIITPAFKFICLLKISHL